MTALTLITVVTGDIALRGFFKVTPILSVNTLYFAPAYPLLLAFVMPILRCGMTAMRENFKDRRANCTSG